MLSRVILDANSPGSHPLANLSFEQAANNQSLLVAEKLQTNHRG